MKLAIYNHGIPFDGSTTQKQPLGGSESSIIYMARALAQCGHEVNVYSNCPNPGDFEGVRYSHYHQFFSEFRSSPWDAVIAFRSFEPMLLGRIAPRMIFWCGDATNQPSLTHFEHGSLQQSTDLVLCVSEWHRQSFIHQFQLPPDKVVATRNGFAPELVAPFLARPASLTAYTSTPFRGLDILLQLFPEIRRRVNSAELDVFSSMQVYGWNAEDDRKAFGAVYGAADQPGVHWRGSVNQPVLLAALAQTGLLLYPNTFEETSCIAAIEAQASGCVVVTSAKAGLNETIANGETGILIEGDPRSESYKRQFIEASTGLMRNEDLFRKMSSVARDRAFRRYAWSSIAFEWTRIFESMTPIPVSGRFSGPLSLLERAHEYARGGNKAAARRVLSNLEATPFLAEEAARLQTHLTEETRTHGRDNQ
ncbi:MAG TPA: glycosyltransferase family 4 protein [Terriglobia bacterium]|nr:glycosyltransferase family 4 protein [Terriglobia bacterium]